MILIGARVSRIQGRYNPTLKGFGWIIDGERKNVGDMENVQK